MHRRFFCLLLPSLLAVVSGCVVHECPEPAYSYEPVPPASGAPLVVEAPASEAPPAETPPGAGAGDALCGGITGAACPANQFCDHAEGTRCGSGDQGGVCRPRPEMCTEEHAPVCGCDGRTYSNACAANRDGVDVGHTGECAAI